MDLQDLDFNPGLHVQQFVWDRFGLPINFYDGLGTQEFFLVISVGRCSFRLNEESVGKILQVAISGLVADFRLLQLHDRVFQFFVSSKHVGFHIYNLKNFECAQFKIFFHLWGNGGAAWNLESHKFFAEEEASWTLVQNKKQRRSKSYADMW